MAAAIEMMGLQKVFRNGRGLLGMDLQIAEGEVFGFLGPNGAGKTTTIRTLLGLLWPTAGSARILGLDVVRESLAVRRKVGYLPGDPALFDWMTGRQHLALSLAVRGCSDRRGPAALAERLGAEMDRPVRQLSRGNRQKVAILLALAHDPAVLMLDEPTSGLDPLMQSTFRDILREERARGKTVFFSSHVLSEVEALADRVGIIRAGRLVEAGSVDQLRGRRLKQLTMRFSGAAPDLGAVAGVRDLVVTDGRLHCVVAGSLAPLLRALSEYPDADITITEPSLDDVFRAYYEGGQFA